MDGEGGEGGGGCKCISKALKVNGKKLYLWEILMQRKSLIQDSKEVTDTQGTGIIYPNDCGTGVSGLSLYTQ